MLFFLGSKRRLKKEKMGEIKVKTKKQIKDMRDGGKYLKEIKEKVGAKIAEGVSAAEIDKLADKLIKKTGGEASFKMVEGYSWATCVNVNEGIVHGIPNKTLVFNRGDVVSVDLGLYYKNLHTDTSLSVGIDINDKKLSFLNYGRKSLKDAIERAIPGNYVYDLSEAMEDGLKEGGYEPVRALVGHGIGENLHEDPQIPCFKHGEREKSEKIPEGAVLAIEIMYGMGSPEVVLDRDDGWTISMRDGKISALFEETVAVTANGPYVLT
jgi:methionyl aminopeptidase